MQSLAAILFWGNVVLALASTARTVQVILTPFIWSHDVASLFPGLPYTAAAAFDLTTVVCGLAVAVFGTVLFWRLRDSRDAPRHAPSASYVYSMVAWMVILVTMASSYETNRLLHTMKATVFSNIRHAMSKYHLGPQFRAAIDHLHSSLNCCGTYGLASEWVQSASGGLLEDATAVPSSCCVVAAANGTCSRYRKLGCTTALEACIFQRKIWFVTYSFFATGWLVILAVCSRRLLRKILSERVFFIRGDLGAPSPVPGHGPGIGPQVQSAEDS